MKPGRNTRLIARPVWSGPRLNRNVPSAPCLRRSAASTGTPSRVPRKVSTSILRARFTQLLLLDELSCLGHLSPVSVEDARQRLVHRHLGPPVEIRARVLDLRDA